MTAARRRPAAPAAPRAIVREMGGGGPRYGVELDPRPVFDFLVSLTHDSEELAELRPEDRRWLADAQRGLSVEQVAFLDVKHGKHGPPNLAGIAVEHPEISDAADYVALVRSADPATVAQMAFSEYAAEHGLSDRLEAALAGDRAAQSAFRKALGDQPTLEAVRDPERWVEHLRDLLDYWFSRYREIEERVVRYLERDVAARRGDLARLAPAEMVERTTGGIRFLADPGVRRVILAPSYFSRPYNIIFSANGWRIFCYPISDDAIGEADPIAPPPAAVRLYRALGDETRLRILRLLAGRDHYLTELAQQLELSKPTIKHHLAQLRAAGLVTLTEEGSLTYYSLRRDRVAEAGEDVMRYLAG